MSFTENRTERPPVDWAGIRARVAALGRTIQAEDSLSPRETQAVLVERARRLAVTSERPGEEDERLELLLFELGGESYGIESRFVMEVLRRPDVALLPGAEPPIVGLAGWRGELLPVLDLRQILGIPTSAGNGPGQLVVLGQPRCGFGVRVDVVQGLRDLQAAEILPFPGPASNGPALLRGTTNDALLVLDAQILIHTFA